MAFEIEGKLHVKYETENKTASFQIREFVIETDGTYPQFVKFQLTQDRCELVDDYKEGDIIKVSFDLRGREWNGKYFTTLNAWRIDKTEPEAKPKNATPTSGNDFPTASDEPTKSYNDDLPF